MANETVKINIKAVGVREFNRIVNKYSRAFKQLSKTITALQKAQVEYQKFLKIMESLKAAKK